jgi:hypothetical protein
MFGHCKRRSCVGITRAGRTVGQLTIESSSAGYRTWFQMDFDVVELSVVSEWYGTKIKRESKGKERS